VWLTHAPVMGQRARALRAVATYVLFFSLSNGSERLYDLTYSLVLVLAEKRRARNVVRIALPTAYICPHILSRPSRPTPHET
jgi:hypothetical protein